MKRPSLFLYTPSSLVNMDPFNKDTTQYERNTRQLGFRHESLTHQYWNPLSGLSTAIVGKKRINKGIFVWLIWPRVLKDKIEKKWLANPEAPAHTRTLLLAEAHTFISERSSYCTIALDCENSWSAQSTTVCGCDDMVARFLNQTIKAFRRGIHRRGKSGGSKQNGVTILVHANIRCA